ncbi:Histone-lysine N-methyltransferase ASHR3, partial [Ananas comosus]
MPDLSNLVLPHFPELRPCGGASSAPDAAAIVAVAADADADAEADADADADGDAEGLDIRWRRRLRFPISAGGTCSVVRRERRGSKKGAAGRSLADHVRDWVEKKVASGVPEKECFLPFLTNSPRMVECRLCSKVIYPREEVQCSISGCQGTFHQTCAKSKGGLSKPFKCPQHGCFICKHKGFWRCVRCIVAAHKKCAPWPDNFVPIKNQPRRAVCWRHPADWLLEKEVDFFFPSLDSDEAFNRLPLPYINEEFSIGAILNDVTENKAEPSPYEDVYLVKKKRNGADAGVGCTNCHPDSTCKDDCECRGLSISCSKACHCSDMCKNKPFRKEKKIKVVKTENCGWGVVALESIDKGDFVIEYIGEVIDDATCEQRLWDMKFRGDQKFYMCEISKDFTIDATFKGNASRFLNHSCNPNCKLEKWQVDGETRVGIFASRSIEVGEPLTYDYRFVLFGSTVKCCCGASNCQGYLGTKKK